MRVFIGIDLDPEVRGRISRLIEGVESFAPEARWVRPESLHLTLKFIGEQAPEQVEAITERMRRVESDAFDIRPAGYGFFPTVKAPIWLWLNSAFRAKTGLTVRISLWREPAADRARRNGRKATPPIKYSRYSKSGSRHWVNLISAQ